MPTLLSASPLLNRLVGSTGKLEIKYSIKNETGEGIRKHWSLGLD
uniref:Uncharacterized protein n=1 Tax=Anguilla anguilla TaxID=7936 RepID=A0A0E9WBP0_ANGAN